MGCSAVEESDELRLRLEAKELSLNESRKMAAAKEQSMLEDKAATEEERERQRAVIAELKARVEEVREQCEGWLRRDGVLTGLWMVDGGWWMADGCRVLFPVGRVPERGGGEQQRSV